MASSPLSIHRFLSQGRRLDEQLGNRQTNNFHLIRLVAALLVMESHCYFKGGDPLYHISGKSMSGSPTAMPVFFFLSGLLVSQSLTQSRSRRNFLWKRLLRLYPAAFFVIALSALFIGPIVSAWPAPAYFANPLVWRYLSGVLLVQVHYLLPGVFEHSPAGSGVNNSLWSLPLELKLYIGLFLASFLKNPRVFNAICAFLAILLAATGIFYNNPVQQMIRTHVWPDFVLYPYTLEAVYFLVGVLCFRFSSRIVVSNYWLVTIIGLFLIGFHWKIVNQLGLILFPLSVLYAATHGTRFIRIITPGPDLSYGIYLWAFPVEQLIIQYLHPASLDILFLLTLLSTTGIALVSWYGIEKKALKWKNRVR